MTWGDPTDVRLVNGLRVVVAPTRLSPLAEVRLLIPASAADTAELAALELIAHCLSQVGPWAAEVDPGHLMIRASVMPQDLTMLLSRLAAAVTGPRHDEAAVRRAVHGRTRTAMPAAGGHRARLIDAALTRGARQRTSYVTPPGAADYATWTHRRLPAEHARFITPAETVLLIAGAAEPAPILEAVSADWSGWTADRAAASRPTGERADAPGVCLPPAGDDDCTTVVAAAPAPMPADRAFPAALLLAAVLTGSLDARLFRALRLWTPSVLNASCVVEHDITGAWILLEADVLDASDSDVIAAINGCLDDLTTRPPLGAELTAARAALFRTSVVPLASTAESATAIVRDLAHGLPWNHALTMTSVAADVEADELSVVAGSFFAPQRFAFAAYGTAERSSSERRVLL
jgi:predicted Zn-dependent peptidase